MERAGGVLRALLFVSLLTALACGDDPAPAPEEAAANAPAAVADAANHPPVVDRVSLEPRDPKPGDTLQATVQASDPDGDPLRLFFSWSVNGKTIDVGTSPAFVPRGLVAGDRVVLEVVASDGRVESEPVQVSVSAGNRGPTISVVAIDPREKVKPGDTLRALVDAADPDGEPLRFEYSWFVNGKSKGSDESFETKGLRRGDEIHVRVVARDRSSRSAPVESAILELGNSPPVFAGVPAREEVDGVFFYKLEARDPDGDRSLRYRLKEGPPGMSIDPLSGVVRWEPDMGHAGVHPVEVIVRDRHGDETFLRWNLNVSVQQAPASAADR